MFPQPYSVELATVFAGLVKGSSAFCTCCHRLEARACGGRVHPSEALEGPQDHIS